MVARTCAKARNQFTCVTAAYLGESGKCEANGEFRLVDEIAPHCRLFVDVGANVGEWSSRFLARSQANGVAYEPSQGAYSVLQATFGTGRMTLRNIALGEDAGEMLFVEEDECGKTSSSVEVHTPSGLKPTRVAVSTLDLEFAGGGETLDFVKIDAEGYDLRVLRGAQSLLESGRIRFVQFEYDHSWLSTGCSLRSAMAFLGARGYSVYLVRTTGIHAFDYQFWGDYFRFSNFLACRLCDLPLLSGLFQGKL